MNTTFSAALCAAALGLGLAGTAHADTFTFVGSTETDGGAPIVSSPVTEAAGSFTDTFMFFNAPSYSLDTYVSSAVSGVSFTGVSLTDITGETVALAGTLSAGAFSFAPSAVLPSAAYELIVTGTSATGGSYSVAFTSSFTDAPAPAAAVPEPANWALLVLGGMGLFGLKGARKRSSTALAA